MAKATLENAILWTLRRNAKASHWPSSWAASRETVACGVSLGIQSSIPELMSMVEREWRPVISASSSKCKPGWDVEVFEQVRSRYPEIMLSCDANSAYRLRDSDHITTFDESTC